MYKEKIIDIQTGKEIWRDYTDLEIEQVKLTEQKNLENLAIQLEKEKAKKAVFEKMGITEEEAKLILG